MIRVIEKPNVFVVPEGTKVVEKGMVPNGYKKVQLPQSVVKIGDRAFMYHESLESINIPDGVTEIGTGAFSDCPLKSINIPNSVTKIGTGAFSNCLITSINIPNSITEIGRYTFQNCPITSIDIPDSVTKIGPGAFQSCPITSIDIPDSVTNLDAIVCQYCSSLKSARLPSNITTVPYGFFDQCSSLESIDIPDSVTEIEADAFEHCDSLKSIKLPNGLKRIGSDAFCQCYSLTSIDIPKSVTEIGSGAFSYCSSLETVNIFNGNIKISKDAFENCNNNLDIKKARKSKNKNSGDSYVEARYDVVANLESDDVSALADEMIDDPDDPVVKAYKEALKDSSVVYRIYDDAEFSGFDEYDPYEWAEIFEPMQYAKFYGGTEEEVSGTVTIIHTKFGDIIQEGGGGYSMLAFGNKTRNGLLKFLKSKI